MAKRQVERRGLAVFTFFYSFFDHLSNRDSERLASLGDRIHMVYNSPGILPRITHCTNAVASGPKTQSGC